MTTKNGPRHWTHLGRKIYRVLSIEDPTPLAELDARGWEVGAKYLLHVRSDGTEMLVPDTADWDRQSLTVKIEAIGEGWIDESTRVGTVEDCDGIILRYLVIPPHGVGWMRDADTDRDYDKWSAWKRRRAIGGQV